jgi:hypothetical protein
MASDLLFSSEQIGITGAKWVKKTLAEPTAVGYHRGECTNLRLERGKTCLCIRAPGVSRPNMLALTWRRVECGYALAMFA